VAAEADLAQAKKDVRKKTPYRDGWKGLDPEDGICGESRGVYDPDFLARVHVRTRATRIGLWILRNTPLGSRQKETVILTNFCFDLSAYTTCSSTDN